MLQGAGAHELKEAFLARAARLVYVAGNYKQTLGKVLARNAFSIKNLFSLKKLGQDILYNKILCLGKA
ncbi:MAG: hypothetical protein LBC41_17205, partial [Clostridiales bacterium]|nr:hypothetical protein [Clostridiales bacterium]